MFEAARDKAVQTMADACAKVQHVMRASLLELVSHLRDRLADQPDDKPQRLRESTLQKLRDFLGGMVSGTILGEGMVAGTCEEISVKTNKNA